MSSARDHEDPTLRASLDELTALLVTEEPLESVLARIVELALHGIGACDYASVTTMRGTEPETVVCTDPIAQQIDEVQYEHDAGPCLFALRRREVVSVGSMTEDDRWTPVREAAMRLGVLSSFSVPMAAGDTKVGALNLYSRQDHGFEAVPPDTALLFAAQAAAAVWNARAHEQTRRVITNLEAALETRDVIGTARGIVMANEKLRSDEAMELLRKASQHRNVKLRDLAVEVAANGRTPEP
jgi:GAF domain-containing protein